MQDLVETHRPSLPLEEEVELLERIARLQVKAETIFGGGAQEDCGDEDEDDLLVSNEGLLGEGESEVVIFVSMTKLTVGLPC